jgi:hypothetical protein
MILDVDGRNKNHSNRYVNNVFANDKKLLPNINFLMVTESIDRMHNDVFNAINNCKKIMKYLK